MTTTNSTRDETTTLSEHVTEHNSDSIVTTHIIGASKKLNAAFYISPDDDFWDTTTADIL